MTIPWPYLVFINTQNPKKTFKKMLQTWKEDQYCNKLVFPLAEGTNSGQAFPLLPHQNTLSRYIRSGTGKTRQNADRHKD